MNLTSLRYNVTFALKERGITAIIIESPDMLEQLVIDLKNQLMKVEEQFLFMIGHEKFALEKRAALITSPLDLVYDKKVVQKKLFANLLEEIETDKILEELNDIFGVILEKLEALAVCSNYHLRFSEDVFISDIMKTFNLRLSTPEGSFCGKLMEYGETLHGLIGTDIFFLVNCDSYLSKEDLSHIIKWSGYQNIHLVFIGGHALPLHEEIHEYIIDEDLCLIYKETAL